eukprot:gene58122-biopygen63656
MASPSCKNQIYASVNRMIRELHDIETKVATERAVGNTSPRNTSVMNDAVKARERRLKDMEESGLLELACRIEAALRKLPAFNPRKLGASAVYRGVNIALDPEVYNPLLCSVGKYLIWPSFSSTSTSRAVGQHFASSAGALFICEVNTRASTAPRDIRMFSRLSHEEEALYPPNTYFRVVGRTSERDMIVNKTQPIVELQQCDLSSLDEQLCAAQHSCARAFWLFNF